MSKIFFKKLTDKCNNLLLKNDDLMHYLKIKRGMSEDIINTYKLGAFPKNFRDLYGDGGIDPKELRDHNIIWNLDQSPFEMYPIVIPIMDTHGDPIAIGCRTLLSEEKRKKKGIPKYRNSTYKKTHYLYGLNQAIDAIREKNKVFVVEGYFDVITPHQKGALNVVATCGTIFSERQIIILSRYTNNICLLFDNDAAGRKSAKRMASRKSIFAKDINITCNFTPDGYKDIDEYLANGGDVNFLGKEKTDLHSAEIKTLW